MSIEHQQHEEDPTGFEDEPLGNSEPIPSSGVAFEFEGVDKAMLKAERRRERRRRRAERVGMIVIAIFCCCVIIAFILIFEVFKVTEKVVHDAFVLETDSPTIAPTHSPTRHDEPAPSKAPKPTFSVTTSSPTKHKTSPPTVAPTMAPTVTSQPSMALRDSYEITAVEDTYVFIDGHNTPRNYGRENTVLVQHGSKISTKPGQVPDIPTSVALLKFDIGKKGGDFPDRSRWPESMPVNLRLTHVPQEDAAADERPDSKLDVYRIPNNYDGALESLTGTLFNSAPRYTKEGVLVAKTNVDPQATDVIIDIKSALYLSNELESTGFYADDQILLMLVINEGKPRSGDEFQSRQSSTPPIIQFVMN